MVPAGLARCGAHRAGHLPQLGHGWFGGAAPRPCSLLPWGVSARFECGAATVDTYAQSQIAQNQAEAEALSLVEVLIDPLGCPEEGFQL